MYYLVLKGVFVVFETRTVLGYDHNITVSSCFKKGNLFSDRGAEAYNTVVELCTTLPVLSQNSSVNDCVAELLNLQPGDIILWSIHV